jgi:para-nitrobenzyl esterase
MNALKRRPFGLVLLIFQVVTFGAALGASTNPSSEKTPTPPVQIDAGAIRGLMLGNGKDVAAFKGIPYAAAPVGERRWKPPQPVEQWQGVRDCFEFGPACPQVVPLLLSAIPEMAIGAATSEDCLYLNVWMPTKHEGKKLPVLYWIYGGGFILGATSQPLYDAEALSRLGCVVVSVNYRVGLFGFLAHPALSAESPDQVSGNYGLLDQIEGLRWVRRNIAAFGGDPDRVTIFGESAGGISVLALMVAPQARGLFHAAIAQSATAMDFAPLRGPAPEGRMTAEDSGRKYIAACGLSDSSNAAQMRKLTADQLLRVAPADASMRPGAPPDLKPLSLPIGPTVDGKVIPEAPRKAFNGAQEHPVPLIIGNTRDEMSMFLMAARMPADQESYLKLLQAELGDVADVIGKEYPGTNPAQIRASVIQLTTDLCFVETTRYFARAHARAGQKAYRYQFSRSSRKGFLQFAGAHHGAEVAFVFQRPPGDDQADKSISQTMGRYWVNFASSGDPSGADLSTWPASSAGEDAMIDFGNAISVLKGYRNPQIDLVEKIVDRASQ